jgi:hypothetical protein
MGPNYVPFKSETPVKTVKTVNVDSLNASAVGMYWTTLKEWPNATNERYYLTKGKRKKEKKERKKERKKREREMEKETKREMSSPPS